MTLDDSLSNKWVGLKLYTCFSMPINGWNGKAVVNDWNKPTRREKKSRKKKWSKKSYAWEHLLKLTSNSTEYFCCYFCCRCRRCVRCWIEINFFVRNTLRWWYVSMGFRWNNKGSSTKHTAIDSKWFLTRMESDFWSRSCWASGYLIIDNSHRWESERASESERKRMWQPCLGAHAIYAQAHTRHSHSYFIHQWCNTTRTVSPRPHFQCTVSRLELSS